MEVLTYISCMDTAYVRENPPPKYPYKVQISNRRASCLTFSENKMGCYSADQNIFYHALKVTLSLLKSTTNNFMFQLLYIYCIYIL